MRSFRAGFFLGATLVAACGGLIADESDGDGTSTGATGDDGEPSSERGSDGSAGDATHDAAGSRDAAVAIDASGADPGGSDAGVEAGGATDGSVSDAAALLDAGASDGSADADADAGAPNDDAGLEETDAGPPVTTATSVGVHGHRTCIVVTGGRVACWGGRWEGNVLVRETSPVAVPDLVDAAQAVPGAAHACALMPDATVRCWGQNDAYQLGDGTTAARSTPGGVPGLAGVTQLVMGSWGAAAVTKSGVYTWGTFHANGWATPEPYLHRSAVPEAQPVYAGASSVAFDEGDGTAGIAALPTGVRWYWNPQWQDTPLLGVTKVTRGWQHICALLEDGTVSCWGGGSGLGDGTTAPRATPKTVPGLSAVTDLVSSDSTVCALAAGEVRCWGNGYVGDGTWSARATPTRIDSLSNIVALSAGASSHTCALRDDGAVFCWGFNGHGQLGDGTLTTRLAPVRVRW